MSAPHPSPPTTRRSRRRHASRRAPGGLRFRFGQSLFVLPNLFTLTGIFCGFYAIVLASGAGGAVQLKRASLAIFFAIFFDMADGRVARLTRTQSAFGVQLDSLADVISFGVAPAVLLYRWSLSAWGLGGTALAFVYVACGAVRLARFNVIAERGDKTSGHYFVGLPIPLAAGLIAASIMVQQRLAGAGMPRAGRGALLGLALAGLMVSSVPYRTFKQTRPTARNLTAFVALLAAFAALATLTAPPFACLTVFVCYAVLGPLEMVRLRLRRARRDANQRRLPRPGPPSGV